MTVRRRTARRGERGFVTAEFVMGLGLIVLPTLLLVALLPTWSERQSLAASAAREASRTYVVTGDENAARAAVKQLSDNHSLPEDTMRVDFRRTTNSVTNVEELTAFVYIQVPAFTFGGFSNMGPSFETRKEHTEVIDRYRVLP